MRSIALRTMLGTVAVGATAAVQLLPAQVVREGTRTSLNDAQVTFGYLCDDRFVVRNEGAQAVRLEYGLDKGDERTALNLDARESVELLLSTSDQLNLFANGKVIASARREYRDCEEVEGSGRVIVRPLPVAVAPTVIVAPYPVYRSYFDPWYHRHTYFRPVMRPILHAVIRVPIVIGGRRDHDRGGRDRDRHDRSGREGRRGR